jgi:hypothetical protein
MILHLSTSALAAIMYGWLIFDLKKQKAKKFPISLSLFMMTSNIAFFVRYFIARTIDEG